MTVGVGFQDASKLSSLLSELWEARDERIYKEALPG